MQTQRLLILAQDSGGRVFAVSNLSELAGEYAKIAQELHTTYSLAYYSTNPQRDGAFRQLRVAVRNPGFKVITRSRYFVPREEMRSGVRSSICSVEVLHERCARP